MTITQIEFDERMESLRQYYQTLPTMTASNENNIAKETNPVVYAQPIPSSNSAEDFGNTKGVCKEYRRLMQRKIGRK
jgi:hypothetical protein